MSDLVHGGKLNTWCRWGFEAHDLALRSPDELEFEWGRMDIIADISRYNIHELCLHMWLGLSPLFIL